MLSVLLAHVNIEGGETKVQSPDAGTETTSLLKRITNVSMASTVISTWPPRILGGHLK
jgi:hypothetical protein